MTKINYIDLKFKNRKIIHYTIIICIIILQILIGITWYNETYNEEKLNKISAKIKASEVLVNNEFKARESFYDAQRNFNNYLIKREESNLNNYNNSLKLMQSYIDSISLNTNSEFKKIVASQNSIQNSKDLLKNKIDSLLFNQLSSNSNKNQDNFNVKDFNYEDVLNSIDIETTKKVDSLKKKGFFGRLGNAVAGKTDVQKEKTDVLIKMKFGQKETTGSIEEQMLNVFKNTNKYYQNEFLKIKNNFNNLKKRDTELIAINNKLMTLSDGLLNLYKKSAAAFNLKNKQDYYNQLKQNKKIKSYTTLFLIITMILITIVLLFFTKIAFQYENKLIKAKNEITKNLNFKNRIVGMISHEVRSPLSIISMLSKRAVAKVEDKEIQEQFKSIGFTTNSLLMLSNQILEFSKNENVKPKLNSSQFELNTEINQIIGSLNPLVENNNNKIIPNINLKNNIVETDLAKIHQLFYNIVGNANKFTKNGNISINIEQNDLQNNNINLNVSIIDTGYGISESDLKNIFKSYYQGTISEKVKDIGAGLGLNLCKELVEQFGGKIDIKSQEGKGTEVSFNLVCKKIN